ncbi:MAG: hypothetical protein AB7O66_11575 [Limisphaerales bacterium]
MRAPFATDPKEHPQRPRARLATIQELQRTLIANYLEPVPSVKTLRRWFDEAGIPRLKANPDAVRGGGTAWWHVAAVERLIRRKAGMVGAGDITGGVV